MKNTIFIIALISTCYVCSFGQATDNIGINLTNPQATLHIRHDGIAPNLINLLNVDNEPMFTLKNNGRLGIGINNPEAELHIKTQLESPLLSFFEPNKAFPIKMTMSNTAGRAWVVDSYVPDPGNSLNSRIKFDYFNTGNVLTIRGNNAMGIRNTSPTYALDISGSLKVSNSLMPNGNPGVAGQVLMSTGTAQAPVWKTLSTLTANNTNIELLTNTGVVGGSGSGFGTVATVAVKPFVANTTTKIATNFSLNVKTNTWPNTGYGRIDMELWQTSTNTLLETHKHYFKVYTTTFLLYDNVNINKIFVVVPPTSLNESYEIRAKIVHLYDAPIRYGDNTGNQTLNRFDENFFSIRLLRE